MGTRRPTDSSRVFKKIDNFLTFDRLFKKRKEVNKMKSLKIMLLSAIVVSLISSFAFAAGNVAQGKALFDDPKAFGAPGDISCSSCHPNGKGLEKSGEKGKKEWKNPGGTWLSLEDASNICIILANKGKAIDPQSEEMKDLVAYIKSLGKKK
jgi:cytochrome c peroxidase